MKQLIVLFLSFLLIFPAATFADTPEPPAEAKVTGIEKGEAAPYSGVLLNSLAASRLFTEKNYSGVECDLKVKYELQKETARMQMLLDTTKLLWILSIKNILLSYKLKMRRLND